MTLFEGLQASPTLLVVAVAILGLLVGSFLNVVILRLPRIMEQNWKRDARDALELPAIEEPRLSLSHPASCCPSCKAPIRPWQNVPVIRRSEERRVGKECVSTCRSRRSQDA